MKEWLIYEGGLGSSFAEDIHCTFVVNEGFSYLSVGIHYGYKQLKAL